MNKFILFTAAAVAIASAFTSCADDDTKSTWEEYADWRQTNITWLEQQQARTNADGTKYYEVVSPSWYVGSYVLVHRVGESNTDNLRPLSSSVVEVIYQGFNCEGERFDSSLAATPGAAVTRNFKLNEVIDGWTAALETMHVGDSAEIICPYQMAYGASAVGSLIQPYSALRFNIRLVDIPAYEVKP